MLRVGGIVRGRPTPRARLGGGCVRSRARGLVIDGNATIDGMPLWVTQTSVLVAFVVGCIARLLPSRPLR